MIAGKDYKEGQKFEVLKKALESDIFEDKLEFWSNFDYWRHHMSDARDLILLFIYKGMKVFFRQSEKNGYDFNLALFEPDFNKEYLDSHFDSQEKTFGSNNEIWKYVNGLIKKGIIMISMKNNLIKIQLVPSSILYINDCWNFLKLDEKEKENYFKKNCGLSPTTIQFDDKDGESIEIMSDILSTTLTINKINIKNSIYYTNEFNMLLFLIKKNQKLEILYSHFQSGFISSISTQISIYADFLLLIIQENKFPIKVNANFITIEGSIVNKIVINNDEFILIKVDWMISSNLKIQYIRDNLLSNNKQIKLLHWSSSILDTRHLS